MWPPLHSIRERRAGGAGWASPGPAALVRSHSARCAGGARGHCRRLPAAWGAGAAAPGSCQLGACRPTPPAGSLAGSQSSSGCLRHGVEMSSPVFRQWLVTDREVALLIYYPVRNLRGAPGCRWERMVNVSLTGSECLCASWDGGARLSAEGMHPTPGPELHTQTPGGSWG